jgi:hypothetical protein
MRGCDRRDLDETLRRSISSFCWVFSQKKCPNANKTGENRKKPVETEEF